MVVVLPTMTPEAIVTVGPLVTAADELAGAAKTAEVASNPRANTFEELKTDMMVSSGSPIVGRIEMRLSER